MQKKKVKSQLKNMKRREFNTGSDILAFEHELNTDELTNEEKEEYTDPQKSLTPEQIEELQGRNYYYRLKDKLVIIITNEVEAKELLDRHEIIAFADYIRGEVEKPYPFDNKIEMIGELEPIIFMNKGKTPPSVPYLRVFLEPGVKGDIKSLHQLYSKTRNS